MAPSLVATYSVDPKKTNFIKYKKAVSYLADIAACKKAIAIAGTADATKYAAEEKKWLGVYESIK